MIDEVESTYRQAVDKAKADYDAAVAKARTEMIERSAARHKLAEESASIKQGDIVWIDCTALQHFGVDFLVQRIARRSGEPTVLTLKAVSRRVAL